MLCISKRSIRYSSYLTYSCCFTIPPSGHSGFIYKVFTTYIYINFAISYQRTYICRAWIACSLLRGVYVHYATIKRDVVPAVFYGYNITTTRSRYSIVIYQFCKVCGSICYKVFHVGYLRPYRVACAWVCCTVCTDPYVYKLCVGGCATVGQGYNIIYTGVCCVYFVL